VTIFNQLASLGSIGTGRSAINSNLADFLWFKLRGPALFALLSTIW